MTTYPLVSIVIPTYNQRPDFLRACINSAINQTYSNFEIVVSDNWSTNELTTKVYEEFIGNERFNLVKPNEHTSMINNFSFVAQQAKGEYISFLCSDDLLEPDAIQILADALLSNPTTELAFGEIEYIDADTSKHLYFKRELKFQEGIYAADQLIALYMNRASMIWMNGNLISRAAYHEIGGIKSDHVTYAHDDAFLLKWFAKGKSLSYVNKLLGKVRDWSDSTQKVEGNRDKVNITDIIEIYNIALKSKFISDSYGYNNIIAVRNKKLEEHALYWCVNYIKGKVTKANLEEVRLIIYKECKSFKIRMYFFSCGVLLKPVSSSIIHLKNKLKLPLPGVLK